MLFMKPIKEIIYRPSLPLSPLARSFINPAQCPTSLTLPLPFTFGALRSWLQILWVTTYILLYTRCILCFMCVGCWQYLKPRIEGRCLAWLFLSQHMLPLKAANVLQKRSNPWWENKGDVWGGGREKKKKTKKYPIFRGGFALVKISGLILLNWVFPLFTGF